MDDRTPFEDENTNDMPCLQAIRSAGRRLEMDPDELAARCIDGELADIIIELRIARHALDAHDRERIEALLRRIGALP